MTDQEFPSQTQAAQPGYEHDMTPEPEYIRANYRGTAKLEDKVAVITGGDSGIGRAVAVHFAAEGADIALVYLNENEDAEVTRTLVQEYGQRCLLLKGDVADPAFCRQTIDDTLREFGSLNILVNTAGEQHDWSDVTAISDSQLLRTFQTNIFSHFYMIKAAVPHMTDGDTIIATSSVNAFKGNDTL